MAVNVACLVANIETASEGVNVWIRGWPKASLDTLVMLGPLWEIYPTRPKSDELWASRVLGLPSQKGLITFNVR